VLAALASFRRNFDSGTHRRRGLCRGGNMSESEHTLDSKPCVSFEKVRAFLVVNIRWRLIGFHSVARKPLEIIRPINRFEAVAIMLV
jgi:hypothetical protein